MGHEHGRRQLLASRRAKQYRDVTTLWLRKIIDCGLYFSLDRLNIADAHVCMQAKILLSLVST